MNTQDKLYLVGDVHGYLPAYKRIVSSLPKGSKVVQLGDFGLLGDERHKADLLAGVLSYCRKADVVMYAFRGNHDDPSYFDGRVLTASDKVERLHLLPDYWVGNICGRRVGVVGGGVSIDRYRRKEGYDYHKDELVKVTDGLIKLVNLDLLLTHSTIQRSNPYHGDMGNIEFFLDLDPALLALLYKEGEDMETIIKTAKDRSPNLTHHFYGHFHKSHVTDVFGVTTRCLDINEVIEAP